MAIGGRSKLGSSFREPKSLGKDKELGKAPAKRRVSKVLLSELAVGDFFRTEKGGEAFRILKLEGDSVVTTKLVVFSNTERVEKLDRLESIKAAGDAAMRGDGR